MSLRRKSIVTAALLLLATLQSCLSFNYNRNSVYEPIEATAVERLEQTQPELQECLDTLGAPIAIWETPSGPALAYGWLDQGAWNVDVSYSFRFLVSVRLNYSSSDLDFNGVVLLFDEKNQLSVVRRGYLKDIAAQTRRRRPANVSSD